MTDITISAPYYNYEASLPWSRYCHSTLAELSHEAIYQLTVDIVPPTLLSRWIVPPLTLRIPGRDLPSMDTRVDQVLSPGGLVLLLTNVEIRNLEGLPDREFLVPPFFRALFQTTGTVRRRHDDLLVNPQDTQAHEMEHDEEIVDSTTMASDHAVNVVRALYALSRARTRPPEVPVEVKKVLNLETFQRLCPVVNVDSEIPQNCSICQFPLEKPDELRKMPNCVHTFHSVCLSQWLTNNSITCPVCREPAATDKKDYGYLGYGTRPDVYVPADSTETEEQEEPELPAWVPIFPYTGGTVARRQ